MDCRGFDGQVARLSEELRRLSERFVCARLVTMNGVDLAQFQFDYDLTWAGFFLNADGTVYARYGSRDAEGPMTKNTTAGLAATMRRVLAAHESFQENRALFEAKRGPAPPYARPEDIPARAVRGLGGRATRGSCIHCHNVHEALHEIEGKENDGRPRVVFKFPFPENIGLTIDEVDAMRVTSVTKGSAATAAGMRPGDELSVMGGQAVLSLADVQYVLHRLPATASLELEVLRPGDDGAAERVRLMLELDGDWRRNDFSWRTSMRHFPPDPGLYVRALEGAEKERIGIDRDRVALQVAGLFGDAVRRSALRDGDIVVSYDGKTASIGAPRFNDHIRVNHFLPGSVLRLEVLRDGERLAVNVEF